MKKVKVEQSCKELFKLDDTKHDFYFKNIEDELVVLPYELILIENKKVGRQLSLVSGHSKAEDDKHFTEVRYDKG